MASTKQPTAAPTKAISAPIPDVNHNGVLDGEDILKQLASEEPRGSEIRTTRQRAHGVLEAMHVREVVATLNQEVADGGVINGETYTGLAFSLNGDLQDIIADVNATIAKDPKTLEKSIAGIKVGIAKNALTTKDGELIIADTKSLFEFAQTFKHTFPNGVELQAKDVQKILLHFGTLQGPAFDPSLTQNMVKARGQNRG